MCYNIRKKETGTGVRAKCLEKCEGKKQQLTTEECVEILKQEPRGILSMLGDDGYPYGIPMTHWYCEENGHLYFHGAKEGHKIDAIEKCDKVSFCVHDEGYRKEGEWALNIKSVVVFGRMKVLEDAEVKKKICENLCLKLYGRSGIYKGRTSKISGSHLVPGTDPGSIMTGKLVNES